MDLMHTGGSQGSMTRCPQTRVSDVKTELFSMRLLPKTTLNICTEQGFPTRAGNRCGCAFCA